MRATDTNMGDRKIADTPFNRSPIFPLRNLSVLPSYSHKSLMDNALRDSFARSNFFPFSPEPFGR
jgi:hypothetical protein